MADSRPLLSSPLQKELPHHSSCIFSPVQNIARRTLQYLHFCNSCLQKYKYKLCAIQIPAKSTEAIAGNQGCICYSVRVHFGGWGMLSMHEPYIRLRRHILHSASIGSLVTAGLGLRRFFCQNRPTNYFDHSHLQKTKDKRQKTKDKRQKTK